MRKTKIYFIVLTILMIFNLTLIGSSFADDQDLFTQGSSYQPNILIILDNSQSMDEDFMGNAVAPYKSESKLVAAKKQLQAIVNKYAGQMRIGLMTYRLPSVNAQYVHNSPYFVSYEPKSYCPNPPDACVDYCKTGDAAKKSTCSSSCQDQNPLFDVDYMDQIITGSTGTKREKYCALIYPKALRMTNPSDTANYIYYKQALPYYSGTNDGTKFLYATTYSLNEAPGANQFIPGCSWAWYGGKTGTSDDNTGYSTYSVNSGLKVTDSDVALGYLNVGRRLFWSYVGRTWFANTSPGGGYLQVPAATSNASPLLAKLVTNENNETAYMNSTQCSGTKSNTCPFVINAGLTPIEGTLQSAINYFKGEKDYKSGDSYTSPIQDSCQRNFVIFITDGLPSVNASGASGSATSLMDPVVSKIDALRALVKSFKIGGVDENFTFNILTYVIGVGMTQDSRTHLNRMASHGGTADEEGNALYADNETAIYTALDTTLSEILAKSYAFATSSISSSRTADENFIYEATFVPMGNNYPLWKGSLKKWSLKTDSSLNEVVWNAGSKLQAMSAADRNMKTLIGSNTPVKFEAKDMDATNYVGYQYFNLTETDPVAAQLAANKIIKYVRGYPTDAAATPPFTNPDNWKLGDIFHSSPITLGTPTPFFIDSKETNPTSPPKKAFDLYREAHPRASTCSGGGTGCDGWGKRMVVVGANDGQYHAFNATTGNEFWSFVPPNLLRKLQYFAHESASSTAGHHFFVDGATTATDAWLPSTPNDGTTKVATDWKTLVMFSLGRNDRVYTSTLGAVPDTSTKYWSSSAYCDTGITEYYNATTAPYYCGYYAFNFTPAPDADPEFKWILKPDVNGLDGNGDPTGPYLGEPWSTISTGRVKINGKERWIGVIGGGYNAAECGTGSCTDTRGKGLIVFDLRNGETLWSYHWGTATGNTTHPDMGYAIPAQVALIDGDYDGYLDHGYVGDIRGNMWQIQFCTKADLATNANCSTSSWKGSLLLDKLSGSGKYPIYMPPTVVRDKNNNIWIYWASGSVVDPTNNDPAAFVYGLKPLRCRDASGNPQPCLRNDLDNITSDKNTYCGSVIDDKWGWYVNLAGHSEKVLAQPVAFDNVLYFTSFTPAIGNSLDCTKTGMARLYAISIDPGVDETTCTVGTGKFSGDRSITVGSGIASKVQLSFGPDGTVKAFVTVSGAGGQEGGTILTPFDPSNIQKRAYMLYWKDKRVE
ncbi:MAG: hypothetical protein BWX99_02187 [Deltaproteobacteria bacterium ADurb.Bin151]|nr:MAG: hypothetical protein BWX99_02187 [Deltaproteobacteria bacterium ADurb.Bin151]